jgi:predicted enzyme related to lactoylglutathione lyase
MSLRLPIERSTHHEREEKQMPEFSSYPPGTPSWVDHATKDLEASNSFYGTLFGWEADDQGEDMGHYTIMRKGGKTVAGNMKAMMEGQPSAWVSYVSVANADATMDLAKKAGAMVFLEPMDVADIGRMAIFADPTGAAIGIWEPKTFQGAELANEAGSFAWNELNTRDVPAAKTFYTEVFGWQPSDLDMEGMQYTEWKLADRTVAGMMAMPDMVPAEVPAHWLVYFAVDDTDAAVSTAAGLGATTFVPPTDIPPGRFAVLADPDGAAFAVIKMNPMTGG